MAYGEARVTGDKSKGTQAALEQLLEWADLPNVAEQLDERQLREIGCDVCREYKIDLASRQPWEESINKTLDRIRKAAEKKSYPFEGAANVRYPLLETAALQFAARAYSAIVPSAQVVKSQVVGADPQGLKRAKGERVAEHMSYQLLTEMEEWEEDTDTLLHQIPFTGCAFRKTFYDPAWKRNRSEMVAALDFVVNQKTRSLQTVPRATHRFDLYPHEVDERMDSGVYSDLDLPKPKAASDDEDATHEILEQHRLLDLNDDGQREPWIVTVHKESEQVLRIVANYDPDELKTVGAGKKEKIAHIKRRAQFVKYPFLRDPAGGFYDIGFGKLLESVSETIDTTLNQMLDAGNLQNSGGGFIGSGLRLKKSQLRFSPGRYHVINQSGAVIKDAIVNIEHPGPSTVLFQLLGLMIEAGERIASVQDVLTGEQSKVQPATTTLALIEQGMKVYTSIYKRIYRALKHELGILFRLNGKHLPDKAYFTVMDSEQAIARADYDLASVDIVPVADPNMVTDMQRLARAQVVSEAAQNPAWAPLMNQQVAMRRYFEAASIENVDELLVPAQPSPQQQAATDLQLRGAEAEVAGKEADAAQTQVETAGRVKEMAQGDADKLGKDMDQQLGGELKAA